MRAYFVVLMFAALGLVAAPVITLPRDEAEAALASAKAAADKYQIDEAIALYTKAIESGRLSPQRLAAAYAGRADARENYTIAYGLKDEELALALADYRKARDLMPREPAYHSAEASALITLGAYPEAMSAFRESFKLEQPYPHWSMIGFARVERIQGRYDEALKHLDALVRLYASEGGTMPIHYHRGRTLYLKGDFAAAVEAFTAGIPKQPDYAFAHMFRACAHARAGALTEAVADMDRAMEILKGLPAEEAWEKTPYAKSEAADRARDTALIKAMAEGRAGAGEGAVLCKTSWNDGQQLRERSPLIGLDTSKIAGADTRPAWRATNLPKAAAACARRARSCAE
jgi:tetratricopeptide (TPR) repeat protein